MSHRTVRCASEATATSRQRSSAKTLNALQCAPERAEVRAGARRRTGQSIGPVRWPHMSELQRSNPNSWVTWLAHRTVRCALRQQPSPTATLVVGAINTPQPPLFKASKFSANTFNTRASAFNTRHKQRDQILSQVRNHSKQISD